MDCFCRIRKEKSTTEPFRCPGWRLLVADILIIGTGHQVNMLAHVERTRKKEKHRVKHRLPREMKRQLGDTRHAVFKEAKITKAEIKPRQ